MPGVDDAGDEARDDDGGAKEELAHITMYGAGGLKVGRLASWRTCAVSVNVAIFCKEPRR